MPRSLRSWRSSTSLIGLPGDQYPARVEALGQQVLAAAVRVGHQHVARLVDDPAVDLLGDAVVEAAVAGLHVEDRDPHALCDIGRHRAVGVAQDQQPVGPLLLEHRLRRLPGLRPTRAAKPPPEMPRVGRARAPRAGRRRRRSASGRSSGRCGPAPARRAVEALDHAAQPDDLRPRPEHRRGSSSAGAARRDAVLAEQVEDQLGIDAADRRSCTRDPRMARLRGPRAAAPGGSA